MECSGDIELRLASDLPQFAQTLDLLLQFSVTRVDALPPLARKLGDQSVKSPAHLTSPSFRFSVDLSALKTACLPLRRVAPL
jgi:hypothetical protein